MRVTIKGLQQAQKAMLRAMAAVKLESGLDRAVHVATTYAHRFAVYVSHRDTGAMANSHMIQREAAARYRIFLSETAKNPRTSALVSVYGVAEHNRGDSHAYYERTYQQGPQILSRASAYLVSQLP